MPTPTDLPTRLRAIYAQLGVNYVQEAADTIERLQAENQALRADTARFDFWFGSRTKTLDINEYMRGVREGWPVARWRVYIDGEMKDHP